MNTYSINVNFSSNGFDVNLFNQLDVYFSYYLVGVAVISVVALRIRKVIKDKKRNETLSQTTAKVQDDWDL
jgi:hypothetical protein